MIELRQQADGIIEYGCAGDVYNFLVYLARLCPAIDTAIMTAIGNDPFSQSMLASWQDEGIGDELATVVESALPGLYMVETDAEGERSFRYWRSESAARQVMKAYQSIASNPQLNAIDWFLVSGISLAILDEQSREKLFSLIKGLQAQGTKIAFDPNYRPALWLNKQQAIDTMTRAYACCDLLLASFEDEMTLFDVSTIDQCLQRFRSVGITEAVLTNGVDDIFGIQGDTFFSVAACAAKRVVDTTSAGDSFNAGYLYRRIQGDSAEDSVKFAAKLASFVVGFSGAIVPAQEFKSLY
jgi:2-dehydro-3-deoxygluconokinase